MLEAVPAVRGHGQVRVETEALDPCASGQRGGRRAEPAHRLARPRSEGHAPVQGRGHGAPPTDPWPECGLVTRRTNEPLDRPVGKPSREQQLVERRFDIGLKR